MLLPASIEHLLDRGGVVLTPNQRAARQISAAYDEQRRQDGVQTWSPAAVLPWNAWTGSVWMQMVVAGDEDRVLLNDVQERRAWEQVLDKDPLPDGEERSRTTVDLCIGAHRLLWEFLARDQLRAFLPTASIDARIYGRWLQRFDEYCRRGRLLPSTAVNGALARKLEERGTSCKPAQEYLLFGFDRLLPSQEALIRALETRESMVTHADAYAEMPQSAPTLVAAPSERAELEVCVSWVRQMLERPGASVAIVVPHLRESASTIERALREAVAPETEDIGTGEAAVPWHIAEGRILSGLPMVADALRLLRWWMGVLPLTEISALLLSPYLAMTGADGRGAEIDAFTLRTLELQRPELSMGETAKLCLPQEKAFAEWLKVRAGAAERLDGVYSHADWSDRARRLLRLAGWPGARERTSEEFQIGERWQEALDRVASLDLLEPAVSYREFVSVLEQSCAAMLFAPENRGAPVQVMSPTEAAGSTADALWFLHGTEAVWHGRRAMHPLLPTRLQRRFQMPGAEAERDAEYTSRVTRRIARSAPEVHFSYADGGTEGKQRPSAAILSLASLRKETAPASTVFAETAPMLEEVEDTSTVPMLPDAVMRGGVSILQKQAACPFRAFAEARLFSTKLQERKLGLDPRDRGTLVHRALEVFWHQVKTQTALKESERAFEDGESVRDRILRLSVDDAFDATPADVWEQEYVAVQKARLFRLLKQWLDYEAERPPFEVLSLEQEASDVRVGPLRLDLRVDRVDRVESSDGDDASILIDYKTGVVQLKEWDGERPGEPQLPVYAVAAGMEHVAAIAFASVRTGEKHLWLDGWPCKSPLLPSSRRRKPDTGFAEQQVRWRAVITELAAQFAQGDAPVDPKEYPTTCKHCDQRILCRLDPAALLAVEEPDDNPEQEETAL